MKLQIKDFSPQMVDRFIRKVVKQSRKAGFRVTKKDFAKLRKHMLSK